MIYLVRRIADADLNKRQVVQISLICIRFFMGPYIVLELSVWVLVDAAAEDQRLRPMLPQQLDEVR